MKKIMYSIGLLSTISISFGWLFKVLHMPGADPLFNFGFLAFALIFVPMRMIRSYKKKVGQVRSDKLRIVSGLSGAIVTALAVMFKIMHLQGADILLIVGVLIFSLGFLPLTFIKMYQKSME